MRTHYEFTLPVPATVVWRLLADADRALGWVPGAEITGIGARSCSGRLKLRVRSMSATYRGTAQLITKDEASGVLAAQLKGSQTRGAGTLKADVDITVGSANGSGAVVSITAEFEITGPVTDAGVAAVESAVERLLAKFANNVQNAVEEAAAVDAAEQPGATTQDPDTEADTQPAFATYGGEIRRVSLPMVARAAAAVAAVVGLVAAVRRLRRR